MVISVQDLQVTLAFFFILAVMPFCTVEQYRTACGLILAILLQPRRFGARQSTAICKILWGAGAAQRRLVWALQFALVPGPLVPATDPPCYGNLHTRPRKIPESNHDCQHGFRLDAGHFRLVLSAAHIKLTATSTASFIHSNYSQLNTDGQCRQDPESGEERTVHEAVFRGPHI